MIDIITEINLKHSVLISVYPISKRDFSNYLLSTYPTDRTEGFNHTYIIQKTVLKVAL